MKEAPVQSTQSVDDAFQAILQANFEYAKSWIPVAYKREAIRGVHQTRVAFRRMRSAVSLFRKAIPREATLEIATEMKWFASEFGPARDSDVFIDEALGDKEIKGIIGPASGEARMMELTQKKNDEAYIQVRAAIDSERFAAFDKKFLDWIANKGWREGLTDKQVKRLDKPITGYATKVLNKRLAKILAAGSDLSVLPDEELHELRIQCKKLRYAIEFFTSLYDAEEMADFTAKFKGVQRQLGIINDVAVMPGLLEWILDGVDEPDVKEFAKGVADQRWSQQGGAKEKLPGLWEILGEVKVPWAG